MKFLPIVLALLSHGGVGVMMKMMIFMAVVIAAAVEVRLLHLVPLPASKSGGRAGASHWHCRRLESRMFGIELTDQPDRLD
jgi:hypothetical protein